MTVVLDTLVAVRRTAMALLARREHGRVALTRKLRQRGAEPEMIETALDRLTEEGLLSEARYLESFVSYRARSGYGPARIREELSQRGTGTVPLLAWGYVGAVSVGSRSWRKPGVASLRATFRLMPGNVRSKVAS